MEEVVCQSCGMPMQSHEEVFGTESDGSMNTEYCKYCYDNGKFLMDTTMEGMIDACLPFLLEQDSSLDKEQTRKQLLKYFPTLKRWKQG